MLTGLGECGMGEQRKLRQSRTDFQRSFCIVHLSPRVIPRRMEWRLSRREAGRSNDGTNASRI